ncbi:hypothetical protein Hanom_Chr16g01502471 [Helianthus anomalus]
MSLSSSQVNSAPRLPSHRTFTIGMRERLSCLVWRSMISTGFSTKCSVSFIWRSSRGIIKSCSARHFRRFDTPKVGWTLLSSSGSSSL